MVGYGSGKSPGRSESLRRNATTWWNKQAGRFGLEFNVQRPRRRAPLVAEALASARGHVVAVVGYLVNAGAHATRDLPRLLAAERELRGTDKPPPCKIGPGLDWDRMPRCGEFDGGSGDTFTRHG